MSKPVTLEHVDGVNKIIMDDGKANAMSVEMLTQLHDALDECEDRGGSVIIQGRQGLFSAGFDLGVFKSGDQEQIHRMLESGALLTKRLLTFPNPTIAVCTGHAIAMGAFILLSVDYRISARGDFKFAANEVAIGLTVPRFATEVCRQRLVPAAFNRGLALAYYFGIDEAQTAGFIDLIVPLENLQAQVEEVAEQFAKLDLAAHTATKLRLRKGAINALTNAIDDDCAEWEARITK